MDPISHALMGLFIGVAMAGILKFKSIKWPAIAGLLGGLIPDVDIVSTLMGSAAFFKYHRVMTHSFIALFVFALIIALVFSRFKIPFKNFFKSDFSKYYALSFVAIFSHLFLDFVTSQGIVFLYPFDPALFSWSFMPLVDIFLLLIFVAGLVVMEMLPKKKVQISAIALIFVVALFATKFTLYNYAENRVYGLDGYDGASLIPHNFDPLEWRVVVDHTDSYFVADYKLFDGISERMEFVKQFNDLIEASKKSELVDRFIEASRFPVAIIQDDGKVFWYDLRVSDDGGLGYTAMVVFDSTKNIIEERVGL